MLWSLLEFTVSLGVITGLFALIFRFVPDAEISWKDVWVGAAITSLFFGVGKALIGLYLGRAAVGSPYGAAGSLVVLVVWVYYSSQILLFGAEFTCVYANDRGPHEKLDKPLNELEPQGTQSISVPSTAASS